MANQDEKASVERFLVILLEKAAADPETPQFLRSQLARIASFKSAKPGLSKRLHVVK